MLPKGPYNPNETEPEILNFWLDGKFYKPEFDPKTGKLMSLEEMQADPREPFCIVCPPPNSYARAHVGNLSGDAYQDVFARYARMNGKKVLMVPGKDHAAQEAEVIYLRDVLGPQGKKKSDFTREEFYQQCYTHFSSLAKTIQEDEKMVGLSADFDRDIFTLDPRIAETIYSTFFKMFDDGMVYKDVRIVNWSPGMGSIIPDIETDRKEREADLTYIGYPLVESINEIKGLNLSETINLTIPFNANTQIDFDESTNRDGLTRSVFVYDEHIPNGVVFNYSLPDKLPISMPVIPEGGDYPISNPLDAEIVAEVSMENLEYYIIRTGSQEIDFTFLQKLHRYITDAISNEYKVRIRNVELSNKLALFKKYIFVATTRPETMLGDTAVIVDPNDERYKDLIGKYVQLPLTDRKIPIIANGRVDKEFGTGAVKLTPAHAPDDYTMMLEWNYRKDFEHMPDYVVKAREDIGEVTYVNVISRESKMVGPSGKYAGMEVLAAREEMIKDLQEQGLIEKIEKITQNVLICDRSKTVIEPIMSSQWFVDVDKLKQPAIESIKSGKVVIHPESMQNKMLHWLENLRDWPISRSIWWGYQFPVWYKGEPTEEVNAEGKIVIKIAGEEITGMQDAVEKGLMKVQKESPGEGWIQDPDVFDTWFSSGQWPFATLTAWGLMDTFYPTQVMEMAYGILELWASRMIMLGLYITGEVPFKDVYIQGHIKAADGRKMSKSLGNNVNIDELNEKYGIDAVRLFYLVGNKAGADYRIDYEKLEGYRRYLNKIWNASKFVTMNTGELSVAEVQDMKLEDLQQESNKKLLQHIQDTHSEVTKLIDNFNIGIASQVLFENFWHIFCDVCLEEAKPHVYVQKNKETGEVISEPAEAEKVETQKVLLYALVSYLKMLHPFIPFITEQIWQLLPAYAEASAGEPGGPETAKSLMYARWQ